MEQGTADMVLPPDLGKALGPVPSVKGLVGLAVDGSWVVFGHGLTA